MNSNNEVKILIGSHGSGKSKWLYDTLIDKSRMENDKSKIDLTKRIYLVVPEQDTNDKQRNWYVAPIICYYKIVDSSNDQICNH